LRDTEVIENSQGLLGNVAKVELLVIDDVSHIGCNASLPCLSLCGKRSAASFDVFVHAIAGYWHAF
jgi:hypothetical protein